MNLDFFAVQNGSEFMHVSSVFVLRAHGGRASKTGENRLVHLLVVLLHLFHSRNTGRRRCD